MTTKKGALDDFKLQFEDVPDKKQKILSKRSKLEKKKAGRAKRPRKPSAIKMLFGYWIEVIST